MKNFSFDEAMCFAYGSTMLTGGSSVGVMDNGEYYVPKYGYVVGGVIGEKSVPFGNVDEFKREYNRFNFTAQLELNQSGSAVIGTWVEDNKIVFDLCNILDDEADALALAKKRGERAIYDLENRREIFVNHQA